MSNVGKGILRVTESFVSLFRLSTEPPSSCLSLPRPLPLPPLPHRTRFLLGAVGIWRQLLVPSVFTFHWKHGGGKWGEVGNFFLIFVLYPKRLYFLNCRHCVSGPWGLAELRVLPFGKPEFYHSRKQI